MGSVNRKYAEENFDRHKIVAAQEQFLLEVVRKSNQTAVKV
jgi:hypothetical protein